MKTFTQRCSLALLTGAAAVVLTACQDTPVSPGGRVSALLTGPEVTNVGTELITLPANGGTVVFGNNEYKLKLPANAVCNPATTSYGPTEWDKPCSPLGLDFVVTASFYNVDGHPRVTFAPDIRFTPTESTSENDWVILYMKDKDAGDAVLGGALRIYWTPTGSTLSVDESLADPTVAVRLQPSSWSIYRRLKHFSSYQVGAGGADSTSGGGSAQ
jgi:hypothetical protein